MYVPRAVFMEPRPRAEPYFSKGRRSYGGVRTRKLFHERRRIERKAGSFSENRTILALSRRRDKLSLSLSFHGLFLPGREIYSFATTLG